MNNQYIQYPPESISVFRALVGNTKRVLQCFGFAKIVPTLCDSWAQFFKILHTRQSEIPLFFRQNFHLSPLRCRCKNSKRFLNFRPPKLPRQSSAGCYKTLERSFRELWMLCNTLVAWQRLHWCCFSRPKELYLVLEATRFSVHLKL